EGQVLLLPNERSVFDLNAQLAADLQPQRQQRWQSASREELLTAVRETAGIRPLEALAEPTVQQAGTVQREGYHIDKLVLRRGDGCPLPMLVFQPEAATAATAYLYVHDGGKAADAAPGGPMEALVRAGHQVVSLDLRGQGETADGRLDPTLGDWRTFFLAYLLGQSVVGAHAEDLMIVGRWMAQAPASTPRKIHLLASGRSGVAAAHAAALNSQFFAQLTLKGGPQSWTVTAGSVEEAKWLTTTVHAALQTYDLPDLIGSLPAGVEVKRVP
ncbi:MAG: hypothetical protein KDA45_13015, partial [Planctomycetales bacterium]|nr:hypothetical protein [Planctomycetales bacterium]